MRVLPLPAPSHRRDCTPCRPALLLRREAGKEKRARDLASYDRLATFDPFLSGDRRDRRLGKTRAHKLLAASKGHDSQGRCIPLRIARLTRSRTFSEAPEAHSLSRHPRGKRRQSPDMNRTDAALILNVDPSASPEEARRAYQELFTEHQVRLTNAPTPALRSLYQARLLELEEAKDALLSTSPSDANSFLPTDHPSIGSPSAIADPPRTQPPAPPRRGPPPPPRQSPLPPPRQTQPPPILRRRNAGTIEYGERGHPAESSAIRQEEMVRRPCNCRDSVGRIPDHE